MRESLVIVIPAYNEEENIDRVLREWYKVIELHPGDGRSRLLVVNDGSRDRTERALKKFSVSHPLFSYVTQENSGHGAAIWNGYNLALSMNADYIFQTDSDGQTTSMDFQAFWARRKKADVITGHRVRRGDGSSRIFVSRVLSWLIRVIFRVTVPDSNCPFRLMNREALENAMDRIPERYHLTNVLLSVLFVKQKRSVIVLPIRFRKRQGGTNSINIRKICLIGLKSLGEFICLERDFRDKTGNGGNR